MQGLTLEALEVLDAVDRKGSYAAAADSLYKVQSKVSYTIKKLEQDIGVQLFEKEGRRSVLTPAGKVLLDQGRHLLEAADRIVEQTRQTATGWESCLTIALDSIIKPDVLFPLIQQFENIHPDIEIHLYEEVLGGNWESITDGRSDLVIGAPEVPLNTQGLEIQKITEVDWVFAVSSHHPLAAKAEALSQKDILPFRAVVVRDSARHLAPLTKRVLEEQPKLVVPTVDMKIQAQLSGVGTGFLPRSLIQTFLNQGRLIELQLEDPPAPTPLHLVWKKCNKGKALQWFVEHLRKTDF